MEDKEFRVEESTAKIDRVWLSTNIPCRTACPIRTDIPGYIQAIMEDDYETAYLINRNDNVLPSILGRVCTRPCESACRHGWEGNGSPVAICHLKRSASDFGFKELDPDITPNGKTVCIVGAGPSGLAAANDLALKGYEVTILEQFEEPGGMLRYGIPRFRLPQDIIAQDVKSITDLGVTLKTNHRIETDDDFEKLKSEYDAVLISGGCMQPKVIDIPNLTTDGVYYGLDFMMLANRDKLTRPMENVIVIGGGFTSVDCTRMAYRLGAKNITLTSIRTRADMVVGEHEIEDMEAEGIEFEFLAAPTKVIKKNGTVVGLELVRNKINSDDLCEAIKGSEFTLEADVVVIAIGQEAEGDIQNNEQAQPQGNLFIAGDFRNGASTVIEAAADGRQAARDIHKKLSNITHKESINIQKVVQTGRKREYDFIPLQPMDKIPLWERSEKDKEVETGFSKDKAAVEAKRCYLCHYNFQIDIDRCIYCMACIDAMPVNCIKMTKDIKVELDGDLTYEETTDWDKVQAIAIDNNQCIRCGNCVEVCPVDCISISKFTLKQTESNV